MKRDVVARAVVAARVREFFHVSGSASPWLARAIVWLICASVIGLPLAAHSPGPTGAGPVLPSPLEPAVPLQEWTVDAGTRPLLTSMVLKRLPPVDPRQRLAPCDKEMEVEMEGACWIPLDLDPCPEGKAIKHNGRCYGRALNASRPSTSGDVYPVNLANP